MAEHSEKLSASLAGRWHLVAADCPEDEIPQHRVDLVFHDEPAGLRGAVISRHNGGEIPFQTVAVSGVELRLKMSPPTDEPATDPPFLVMAAVADRFEGRWDTPGVEHIRLKLVPARD